MLYTQCHTNIVRPYIAAKTLDKCVIAGSVLVIFPMLLLMLTGNSIAASFLALPFLVRGFFLDQTPKLVLTRARIIFCIALLFSNAALHQYVLIPLLSAQ